MQLSVATSKYFVPQSEIFNASFSSSNPGELSVDLREQYPVATYAL